MSCKALTTALPRAFAALERHWQMRKLSPAALAELTLIEQRAHRHPWRREHLQSSLQRHCGIGLYSDEGCCVAYSFFTMVAAEAELLLFVVDKPWQGRGLGYCFLARLMELLDGAVETCFLEVRLSNRAAIALYEKVGFNQVGVRPNYYGNDSGGREDALIYAYSPLAPPLP